MTIIHITPTRMRAIQYHDLRDALEEVGEAIPPNADQMTSGAIATLEARIWSLQAHVAQLKQTVQQIEACAAQRGMQNDIGPASWDPDVSAAWAEFVQAAPCEDDQ